MTAGQEQAYCSAHIFLTFYGKHAFEAAGKVEDELMPQLAAAADVLQVILTEESGYLPGAHSLSGVGDANQDIGPLAGRDDADGTLTGIFIGIVDQVAENGDQHVRVGIELQLFIHFIGQLVAALLDLFAKKIIDLLQQRADWEKAAADAEIIFLARDPEQEILRKIIDIQRSFLDQPGALLRLRGRQAGLVIMQVSGQHGEEAKRGPEVVDDQ